MNNPYDISIFNSIVQNRRSVYPYQFRKGETVPDGIIWQILENAHRAPTHKLTEPWQFTVFTGEGLPFFAKWQSEIYTRYAGEKFREKKRKHLEEYPLLSSHVIAVCMKRNEENKLPETEEIIATACAVENMYLTLTAYGLGGYLSTGGITYFEEAKKDLGLGPADKLIGFFYIGYPENEPMPRSGRTPVRQKVRWIDHG
jgi:nitroreductase